MAKKQTPASTRVQSYDHKHEESLVVFMSFAPEDIGVANEIAADLKAFGDIQIQPFQEHVSTQSERNLRAVHRQIQNSDAFLLLLSANTIDEDAADVQDRGGAYAPLVFKPFVSDAYYHALHHRLATGKPTSLVKAHLPDMPPTPLIPTELAQFTDVDYRDPHSGKTQIDSLVRALRNAHTEKDSPTFAGALAPNPRFELFKRVIHSEFEIAFQRHMSPIRQSVDQFANIAKAQDNLMTPELISLKEANAFDDIWVVSQSLHNDLYDPEIAESVKKNIGSKGIRYTYFVPESPLIQRKLEQLRPTFDEYLNKGKGTKGAYEIVFLEVGVFMPFDEMVIYDGENTPQRWGYFQMSHDRLNSERLFMKVPDRTLSSVIEYLKLQKAASA